MAEGSGHLAETEAGGGDAGASSTLPSSAGGVAHPPPRPTFHALHREQK